MIRLLALLEYFLYSSCFFGVVVHTAVLPFNSVQNQLSSEEAFDELRKLKIGQLNFIQTTDTHGWLGSHLNQDDYNAKWGDFISFVTRLKENAVGDNDILIIDSGDKHDGNGLCDATYPNGLNSSEIFNELEYDLLTIGNHELYAEEVTVLEYRDTAMNPKFKGKYISSNVEFVEDDGTLVPFGSKYRYFKTEKHGIRVLALAFIFNFERSNKRAKLTPAVDEIQKDWFKELIQKFPREKVDVLVVFGHLPITDPENREINLLHSELRHIYPNTVIQYFGGHTHVRDFVELDNKAYALQSGRFCETVGFASIDDIKKESPVVSRRYIDFNLRSFKYHSKCASDEEFHTNLGSQVNMRVDNLRENLNLTASFGNVPQTYYMYNKPLSSPHNIYNFLTTKVLPRLVPENVLRSSRKPRLIMINTGSIRYDLHEGPFTVDTEFTISPFSNTWNYIELPYTLAIQIESYLNGIGPIMTLNVPGFNRRQCPFINDKRLTKGYSTSDDLGCKGDDTLHRSMHEYRIPNVVQAIDFQDDMKTDEDELVDVVYGSFIQGFILQAVNDLNEDQNITEHKYSELDCKIYGGASVKDLLREYIISIE